jgi:hypothetical protein
MTLKPFAPIVFLLLAGLSANAQSPNLRTIHASNEVIAPANGSLALRAIKALKLLEEDVVVYKSVGEFEEGRGLARVSFETFAAHLHETSGEVEEILSTLPEGSLRSAINNSLRSYQDGAFWWEQTSQSKVVKVSEFALALQTTSADAVYKTTVPYTVAINWRHASKYLKRAESLLVSSTN